MFKNLLERSKFVYCSTGVVPEGVVGDPGDPEGVSPAPPRDHHGVGAQCTVLPGHHVIHVVTREIKKCSIGLKVRDLS